MHRSRFSSLIIDCRADDLVVAANFWSAALGRPIRANAGPAHDKYVPLEMGDDEPVIELQQVEHDSRVHLDIESDDIEAEVRRLEALGARRVAAIRTWVVMEAPTGQRFCVIRPQRGDTGPTRTLGNEGAGFCEKSGQGGPFQCCISAGAMFCVSLGAAALRDDRKLIC